MRNIKHVGFLLPAIILIILFGNVARAAQGSANQFSAKVKVTVSADDNIKGQVESYIKRELRSLQDVTLVDEGADWELSILAMEVSTKGGYTSGVILSVVILSTFNNQMVSGMLQEKYKELGTNLTKGLYLYPDHWLRAGADDQLRSLCIKLIADFDSEKLEESRKQYREIMKIIESSSPNK
ncbi:hypothetical protein QVG61_03055 [Thiohalobacter sp. IOR34]|uniref:hypothetical protein n=1 Tax=Thiohalobacter sp. IOR34 TaxID=3057176 RepID=UPI0025B0BBCB|nr:hypothetical protein [Thiohalobacter sp. IOR34]WJW76086.1 hypothetical protein QVG61_03055 [Thiohalobacter sp. IOR34]